MTQELREDLQRAVQGACGGADIDEIGVVEA